MTGKHPVNLGKLYLIHQKLARELRLRMRTVKSPLQCGQMMEQRINSGVKIRPLQIAIKPTVHLP